jgi:hypothetical protein
MVLAILAIMSVVPLSLIRQYAASFMGAVAYLAVNFVLLGVGGFGSAAGKSGFPVDAERTVPHNSVYGVMLIPVFLITLTTGWISSQSQFIHVSLMDVTIGGLALASLLWGLVLYRPEKMASLGFRGSVFVILVSLLVAVSAGLEYSSRSNWFLFMSSWICMFGILVGALRVLGETFHAEEQCSLRGT